ncbi:hypothetical protein JCM6882_004499 [Rhodosporidiobolus microsporus]
MSTRTRLPRKAASAAIYTYDAPSDEEELADESESDEDEVGGRRTKGKKKAAPKRRKVAESDSEDESDDDDADAEPDEGDEEKEVEYDLPRVDFSKILPYELVVEILSYLNPATLYSLSGLSKSFYALLSGDLVTQIWRKLFTSEPPELRDEEIAPRKLCALYCDKECEFCGKPNVECGDRYLLLRLCKECREANLTLASDAAAQKTFADLHPATLQCAMTTPLPPDSPRRSRHKKQYYYLPDLHALNEEILHLQLEDDADAENPFGDEPDQREVQKSLARAGKIRRRWWQRDAREVVEEMETTLADKYSPRVKEFVLERRMVKKEREKLADWYSSNDWRLRLSEDAAAAYSFERVMSEMRRAAIQLKIEDAGVFDSSDIENYWEWRNKCLVFKAEPLTDAIWDQIEEPVYVLLGKDIALKIFYKSASKSSSTLFKKPKSRSAEAWAYLEPALRKLYKKHKAQKKADKQARLGESKRLNKEPFFRARWSKIIAAHSNELVASYVPRYGTFLALPSVKTLYLDPKFGTKGEDDETDMKTWSESFDDILEEVADYILSLRFHALKLILAVTTEMDPEELDDLDPDVLGQTGEYDDDFFRRPSSWLYCSKCNCFGPLVKVLQHAHKAHPIDRLSDEPESTTKREEDGSSKLAMMEDAARAAGEEDTTAKDAPLLETKPAPPADSPFPIDLPLEVAVAFSAIFELAKMDESDASISAKDISGAFDEEKLVWENIPGGRRKKRQAEWQDLLDEVRLVAQELAKKDEVMPVPTIAVSGLTSRERWRIQWAQRRAEMAALYRRNR